MKRNLIEHLYLKALVGSSRWPRLVDGDLEKAVRLYWKYKTGSQLSLDNPQTLNEKIQWLKLHADRGQWSLLADKLRVKEYLEQKGFGHYLPVTYGSWQRADEIDFDLLPENYVLKCNHDCASTIIVKDKRLLDREAAVRRLQKHLETPFGYRTVEPHYLDIPPCIMAEEMIGTPEYFARHSSLVDYKLWCFNGHAELCLVCYDRSFGNNHVMKDLYTVRPWRPAREGLVEGCAAEPLPEPTGWEEMVTLAEALSEGHPQVRVDLYNVDGRIYFGELTFTAYGGTMPYFTPELQQRLGRLVDLGLVEPAMRKRI